MTFTNSFKSIKSKVVAVDIDGTICTEERTFERPLATPLPNAIDALKVLKENDNTIILWTGRGWEQYKITKEWLDKHGVPYDQILMGKPVVNYIIDDRARHFKLWCSLEI